MHYGLELICVNQGRYEIRGVSIYCKAFQGILGRLRRVSETFQGVSRQLRLFQNVTEGFRRFSGQFHGVLGEFQRISRHFRVIQFCLGDTKVSESFQCVSRRFRAFQKVRGVLGGYPGSRISFMGVSEEF